MRYIQANVCVQFLELCVILNYFFLLLDCVTWK